MNDTRFAEMISKIAHELRSPLTSVKGFSSTLVSRWERFDDEQKYDLVQAIAADADRMGRIISEVLDLARLEADQLELNELPVSVTELIDQAISDLRLMPGVERISVDVQDDLKITVDPERFRHVLFNLLENSLRFSAEGPIEVTAGVAEKVTLISVTDRGVGIPAERIPTLFDGPGPRTQSATPQGSGLGLYMSRRLVESHAGTISVTSHEDLGTTFEIVLPVKGS